MHFPLDSSWLKLTQYPLRSTPSVVSGVHPSSFRRALLKIHFFSFFFLASSCGAPPFGFLRRIFCRHSGFWLTGLIRLLRFLRLDPTDEYPLGLIHLPDLTNPKNFPVVWLPELVMQLAVYITHDAMPSPASTSLSTASSVALGCPCWYIILDPLPSWKPRTEGGTVTFLFNCLSNFCLFHPFSIDSCIYSHIHIYTH